MRSGPRIGSVFVVNVTPASAAPAYAAAPPPTTTSRRPHSAPGTPRDCGGPHRRPRSGTKKINPKNNCRRDSLRLQVVGLVGALGARCALLGALCGLVDVLVGGDRL